MQSPANYRKAMSEVNDWWADSSDERCVLEITDRDDVGTDLRAPQRDDTGHVHRAYALVPRVRPLIT